MALWPVEGGQGSDPWFRLNPLSSGDGFVARQLVPEQDLEFCLNPLSSGDGFVARAS